MCCPFPGICKPEIGDVHGELNNLMLSHLGLGVVIMKLCKDLLWIILKFLGELLSSFSLECQGIENMNMEVMWGVLGVDQSGWWNRTRKFCHKRINLLGAGTDPDQYLQIPRHCTVEGQRQDGMGV